PAPERGEQRQAFLQEPPPPFGLERQHSAQRLARVRAAELLLAAAEAGEILLREVDAPASEILRDVLAVLCELQSRADAVRQRDQLGLPMSEDAEHDLPHRVG